eukprot:4414101-Karenia_brevis.AAC.1
MMMMLMMTMTTTKTTMTTLTMMMMMLVKQVEQSKHKKATVRVRAGDLDSACEISTFVTLTARPAQQKMYWNMLQLYDALRLTTYGGVASKWVWCVGPTYKKALKEPNDDEDGKKHYIMMIQRA